MNSKYTFYPNGKRIIIDFEKVSYKTHKDVDVSMLEPAQIPVEDRVSYNGAPVRDVIDSLMEYIDKPNARIQIINGDSYDDDDLAVCYTKTETDHQFAVRKSNTQKDIFGKWKEYNDKKEKAEKNKQKTIENLRKQAEQLGFDLTKKD